MHSKKKDEEHSRLAVFKAQSLDAPLQMPEIGKFGYLIEYLSELGFCSNRGFNLTGFEFGEIGDWEVLTNLNLKVIERIWMHKLSKIYAASYLRFNNSDQSDPYVVIRPMDRTELSNKLKSALRSMKVNYSG